MTPNPKPSPSAPYGHTLVYFIKDEYRGGCGPIELVNEECLFIEGLVFVSDEEHDICILKALVHVCVHRFMQGIGRSIDIAGRIGEDDLVAGFIHQADDTVAGGLRLWRNDRKPLTHERVHEGGFTYIG